MDELQARLIEQIESDTRETRGYTGRARLSESVVEAMRTVPRHEFVGRYGLRAAYANRPLPIGHGQTISQPFIVALMTDLMEPKPGHKVLEIGTGSGYQAAVLSVLVDAVYTIEIIPALAESAAGRSGRTGLRQRVRQSGGRLLRLAGGRSLRRHHRHRRRAGHPGRTC